MTATRLIEQHDYPVSLNVHRVKTQLVCSTAKCGFMRVMAATGGNITQTAGMAGMQRQAVYQKLRRLEIDPSGFKPS